MKTHCKREREEENSLEQNITDVDCQDYVNQDTKQAKIQENNFICVTDLLYERDSRYLEDMDDNHICSDFRHIQEEKDITPKSKFSDNKLFRIEYYASFHFVGDDGSCDHKFIFDKENYDKYVCSCKNPAYKLLCDADECFIDYYLCTADKQHPKECVSVEVLHHQLKIVFENALYKNCKSLRSDLCERIDEYSNGLRDNDIEKFKGRFPQFSNVGKEDFQKLSKAIEDGTHEICLSVNRLWKKE